MEEKEKERQTAIEH